MDTPPDCVGINLLNMQNRGIVLNNKATTDNLIGENCYFSSKVDRNNKILISP